MGARTVVQLFNRPAARNTIGQHLCCLYESEDEVSATALSFITAGLMMNEKCAVIGSESRLAAIERDLRAAGVYTDMLCFSGQLVFRTDLTECPLSASAVNVAETGREAADVVAALTVCGFTGYRCVFAVTDFLCHLNGQSLIEREISLNRLLSKLPATLLLLYDRRLMSDAIMADMMEIHPRLIDRGAMYENAGYVLPEELL
jgi:hypothetical protein